jgi:uncharacterized protein YerC
VQYLSEFQETIAGVLDMPTDDCVRTLAGEGKSYRESRLRLQRLSEAVIDQNLQSIRSARKILQIQYPFLQEREPGDEILDASHALSNALESETFYDDLAVINNSKTLISSRFQKLYLNLHEERSKAYSSAIDDIKGLPEWAQISENPDLGESRRLGILSSMRNKVCTDLHFAEDSDTCMNCRANIPQMESDLAAVDSLKSRTIREIQELATPERRIVRVRVSTILGSIIEKPDGPNDANEFEARLTERLNELKEHLLKLLAEGARIILE